ncbi:MULTISPECIES: RipA family octameric membrane protein [unclassified Nocardiopsis]|uniref:RipA family octameric membrane protein n=1 Tax=Nocardiopsis TaxID=2013 RepID=UPI00387AB5DC
MKSWLAALGKKLAMLDGGGETKQKLPQASVVDGSIQDDLELYKIAVEMADRVSARRGVANSFFLTVQTALVAVVGFSQGGAEDVSTAAQVAFALAGVVLSLSWWMQLRSYRELNEAKFKVINKMESRFSIKIFSEEWAYLKPDPVSHSKKRYAELGSIERIVPWVFVGLHIMVLVASVDWTWVCI